MQDIERIARLLARMQGSLAPIKGNGLPNLKHVMLSCQPDANLNHFIVNSVD
jgi:hypothetical protein